MKVCPTPPARPHFTHLLAGDLEIFAGLACDAIPDHAEHAPPAEEADASAEDATRKITLGRRPFFLPAPI